MSLEPISLRLQGREGWMRPGSYLVAVRAFWNLLQNLDVALSREPQGSVDWEISACKRSGPAVVVFIGHLRRPPKDVVGETRRTLLNGIRKMSTSDERPHGFTDSALDQLRVLAEQRTSMDEIAIVVEEAEAFVEWSFIERVERMTHNDYEALSSVVGTLESISVSRNSRFSVRSEITGHPVMCRFKRNQFTEQAKEFLGKRVVVFGNLKSNYLGEPTLMRVTEMEACPEEEKLPNIPRMSGRIPAPAARPASRGQTSGARYAK
ncbi:MAG: hypothetical protein ACRD59_18240 [Candidatus Acidiferrales bacterium]